MIELRPYQQEAVAAVLAAKDKGVRRQLGVAATGLGKTIIFADLARRLDCRTLIMAHRDELIQQAVDKLLTVWPAANVGVVKAERNETAAQVVVASVQTLARPNRLRQVGSFDFVVVDEAHHAVAASYRDVLDGLHAFDADGPLTLGVTATADRGDKIGLQKVFEELVFSYDILFGIKEGYLSDLRAVQVLVAVDLDQVEQRGGDYDDDSLAAALEEAKAPAQVLAAWEEHAAGRKTLLFTPTVDMAQKMAAEFLNAGIPAGWVSGDIPTEERREILRRFRDGEITVLANCAVLTEGYDEPSTQCVIIARPTKSRPLYVQMVGRGTRRHPDKQDCLVLDVVGASSRHDLITTPTLFGLDPDAMANGEATVSEALEEKEQARLAAEAVQRDGKLVAREVDLFGARLAKAKLAWVDAGAGRYALSVADGALILTQQGSTWAAVLRPRSGPERVLISQVDLELAQGVAEDYARKTSRWLASREAGWRRWPATEKQLEALRRWGITPRPGITKGEASDMLTACCARARRRWA